MKRVISSVSLTFDVTPLPGARDSEEDEDAHAIPKFWPSQSAERRRGFLLSLRAQRLKKFKISLQDWDFQARLKISSEPPTKALLFVGNSEGRKGRKGTEKRGRRVASKGDKRKKRSLKTGQIWEDFAGVLLVDFSGHPFPQKRGIKIRWQNPRQNVDVN